MQYLAHSRNRIAINVILKFLKEIYVYLDHLRYQSYFDMTYLKMHCIFCYFIKENIELFLEV